MKKYNTHQSKIKRLIPLITATFALIVMVCFSTNSYAQWNNVFIEDWESETIGDFTGNATWTVTENGDESVDIQIVSNGTKTLYMEDADNKPTPDIVELTNGIDVSSATAVRLKYDYLFPLGAYDAGEYFSIEVWNGSWNEVVKYENGTDVWVTNATVDVTAYKNANFKVRFNNVSSSSSECTYIDNFYIQIQAPCSGATKLIFETNKPPSQVNKDEAFTVKVKAVDDSDILCDDNTSTITLALNTGTGTLSSVTGLNQTLVAGVYEWTDVKYNTAEDFTIKATDDAAVLSQATSGTIECIYTDKYFVNDNSITGDTWCTGIGNDANHGRRADKPKLTITDVIANYALTSNDTVFVDKGTYKTANEVNTAIEITSSDQGSGSGQVIFQGADTTKTIIDCENVNDGFIISGSYITIDGFKIINADNIAIELDPCVEDVDVEYVEIKFCEIIGSGGDGIAFSGCGTDPGSECYTCNNNKIHHNIIFAGDNGIHIEGSYGTLPYCQLADKYRCEYNEIYNNLIKSGLDGINCTYGIDHTEIYYNEIATDNRTAIDLTSGGSHDLMYTLIHNNFICGSERGIHHTGGRCNYSKILFNTFHTSETCVHWEFGEAGDGDLVDIKNNIFYCTGGIGDYCLFVWDDADYEVPDINYNWYYKSTSSSDYVAYTSAVGTIYDLDEVDHWQAGETTGGTPFFAPGFDDNSTFGTDPQLTGMHLSSSSPCISAGTPIAGYTFDFDGDSRPDGSKGAVNPDIGGDEYTAAGHPPCICDEMLLPIELLFFTAVCKDEEVQLNWATASETNNDFFTLEKCRDEECLVSDNWELVTNVYGAGNSNTVLNYSVIDKCPYKETTYYRLKQTDYNGAYEYFDMAAVNCKETADDGLEFIYVAQNQNRDGITVLFNSNEETEFGLYLFDILGHKIVFENGKSDYGLNLVSINTGNLPCGIYLVVLQNEDKAVTKKIMIN